MNRPAQILIGTLAIAITLSAAILQGRWTNRWGAPGAMDRAAAVCQQMPHEVGQWRLEQAQDLPQSVRAILQCDHYLNGDYVNRKTGDRVLVTLLAGAPGPMSVHTPEICYGSADFALVGTRQRVRLEDGDNSDTFWSATFRDVHDVQSGLVRVYYSWTDGTKWTAEDEPRLIFGGRPFLFKAQILARLPDGAAADSTDSARGFLADFLPAFSETARRADLNATD
jgi:hypothetical protein